MAEEKTFKKIEDLSEKKEEKEFLARSEIKTMEKDVAALRETQAIQEREKIAKLKTEEEAQKEKEKELRAQKAALEREMAEKEAKRKEEELKRLREASLKEGEPRPEESGREKEEKKELEERLKETQTKEEEERRIFLERVEAKAEGKEGLPVPPPEPKRYMPKLSFKRPSFSQKLWIRIVLTLLLLAILATVATFWYWCLVVREKPTFPPPVIEEEIIPIVPKKPEIVKPLITDRILEWGYYVPTSPRIIDTMVIHSTYNIFSEDPHDLEDIIQEYKYYGVAAHYLISRQGTIYRLAPDESIAYHAGVSQMPDGRTNVNDFSIGIELIQTKTESPTEAQYQSLTQLVKYLKKEYNIPFKNILGHKDVSPDRKTDPWNFDWGKFNQLIQ